MTQTRIPVTAGSVTELLRAELIKVDTSARRLAEYSFDASNYRVQPLGVIFPRDAAQVATAIKACRATDTALTFRGGGTSMAGNAVGPGLILDFSRHMHALLGLDAQSGWVDVQPGMVLANLTAEVEARTAGKLSFAPDPSSKTRASIGGSIGNDACGNHSVRYGRTGFLQIALH